MTYPSKAGPTGQRCWGCKRGASGQTGCTVSDRPGQPRRSIRLERGRRSAVGVVAQPFDPAVGYFQPVMSRMVALPVMLCWMLT